MIRNPILDDIRSSIHSRPIPWKGLNRANIVSENEVEFFESLGKLNSAERIDRVQNNASKYADMIVELFAKDIRDDLVKYLVMFVIEYGSTSPAFADSVASHSTAFSSLVSLLSRNDEQIPLLAAVSIGVLASSNVLAPPETIEVLFKYIIQNLLFTAKSDIQYKDLGTQLLVRVLQSPRYRSIFYPLEGEAIPAVIALVASAPLQVQYSGLLVLWVLSFDQNTCLRFVSEFNIVPVVLDTAKTALKEKIVRLSIAILANLVKLVPKVAVPMLIAEGTLSTVKLLEARKWNDEELLADFETVRNTLTAAYDSMTTFEEYQAELNAQRLRWTPVHKNRAFWIENIDEFKQRDWTALKQLIQLTSTSSDPVTLAVACHDIAAIVEEAPEAIQTITRAGGKVRLMELIAHQDAEVRYEALKATQRMISHIFV